MLGIEKAYKEVLFRIKEKVLLNLIKGGKRHD